MNQSDVYYTATAMKVYGGSFAQAMGGALMHADLTNQVRIIEAFPDLVQKYGPGSYFFGDVYFAACGLPFVQSPSSQVEGMRWPSDFDSPHSFAKRGG